MGMGIGKEKWEIKFGNPIITPIKVPMPDKCLIKLEYTTKMKIFELFNLPK